MSTTILIKFAVCRHCCSQGLSPRLIMRAVDGTPSSSSQKELIYFRTTTVKSTSSGSRPALGVFVLAEGSLESKFWTVRKKGEVLVGGAYEPLGSGCLALLAPRALETCFILPNWRLSFIVNILKIDFLFINSALPKSENYKSALKKQHNFHILSPTNWFLGFFKKTCWKGHLMILVKSTSPLTAGWRGS